MGKKSGSIRTERIKLRHQDVRYVLEYKKGQENFAGYLSRHAIKWKDVSKSERERGVKSFDKTFVYPTCNPSFRRIGNERDCRTHPKR